MKRVKLKNGCYKKICYYDDAETKIQSKYHYNSKCKLHRLDGPAMIWYHRSGEIRTERYFINDEYYSKEDFYKIININRNLKLLNKK